METRHYGHSARTGISGFGLHKERAVFGDDFPLEGVECLLGVRRHRATAGLKVPLGTCIAVRIRFNPHPLLIHTLLILLQLFVLF